MKESIVENKDIKTNVYYLKFALQFSDESIEDLVASFNHEVNNKGWTSMRAYHDRALIDEFLRRGIDISCVHNGHSTWFNRHVRYNIFENKLETID
jgi:hypothetical protein